MLALEPMLRATTLLTAVGVIAASIVGHGSAGLVIGAGMALANLAVMAVIVGRFGSALVAGSSPTAGLIALQGKFLMLPIAMVVAGTVLGFEAVVLGYAVAATSFTLAVPAIALLPTPLPPVESL